MSTKPAKRATTIEDLNDRLAGRIAREAELKRIRAAQAAQRFAASPPPTAPGGRAALRGPVVRRARGVL